MHKCTYCDRELKSKAGQLRHESACKAREQTDEDRVIIYDKLEVGVDCDRGIELQKPNVVQLEVMGGAETYYDGHPRRLTKLKGMLSATFDKTERRKIFNMIKELENGKV